jgi:steroid 5-alpha reductase family enzyme
VGYAVFRLLDGGAVSWSAFWAGLAVSSAATAVVWVFSIANNNSSIYDPYWVIAPPLLALALKAFGDGSLAGPWAVRQLVILGCLVFWATRYHVFYAWSGWRTGIVHEDWRYEDMRSAPLPYWLNSLVGMHFFPTLLVYFAFAPATLVLMADANALPGIRLLDLLGAAGALTAVAIEFAADRQLRAYRASDEYRAGGTCRTGLWKYSRHPNYFGEVLFWLSMVPFAIAAGFFGTQPVLVLAGPVAMAAFFRFSSWLMDKRSLERRPEYKVVMNEVSAMVPWWPRSQEPGERNAPAR